MRGKIESLVEFLRNFQNADGAFDSYSSTIEAGKHVDYTYSTICTTGYIAYVLSYLTDIPIATGIQKKAIEFLLRNKSKSTTWNYWSNETTEYSTFPYPDDTDDTFTALIALHKYSPDCISGTSLAQIVQGLVAIEKDIGGPYYTWYTKSQKPEWKDIDCVANAQIAYFLALRTINVPNLTSYIEGIIQTNKLTSQYYPTSLHCMYFVARWYSGQYSEKLAQFILSYITSHEETITLLEIALAISSLSHLKRLPKSLLRKFKKDIDSDENCIKPFPFCIDPVRDGKAYISSSPAITAAAIIEALHLSQDAPMKKTLPTNDPAHRYISKAHERLLQLADCLPIYIQEKFVDVVKTSLETQAGKQCVAAACMVVSALQAWDSIPESILEDICFAQACGWTAYEVFDDIVDENKNENLGIGLMLYTHMSNAFSKLLGSSEYGNDVTDSLLKMNISLAEDSYHIETKGTTMKNSKEDWMIQKSAGYILGPLAVLHFLGYSRNSSTTKNICAYFHHVIQALQLSDDAHDWQEDSISFQRNAVLEMLPKLQTLSDDTQEAYFWETGIDRVLKAIQIHCASARKAYTVIIGLHNPHILEEPLKKIEAMCNKTMQEKETVKEFLKTYE